MTTIDDLRRSLDERAAAASDGAGMAERAQLGAQRIKRRRTIGATVAVCLLALVATVVPVVVTRLHADGPSPAAIPFYRGPGQLTVSAAPGSRFDWGLGSDGYQQWMTPRPKGGRTSEVDCCAEVRVHDPGTYDSRALRAGERITVAGHPGFRAMTSAGVTEIVQGQPSATEGPAHSQPPKVLTIGWQDPSGAWVTVIGTAPVMSPGTPVEHDQRFMLEVAADVRLGAPRDVLVPVHFPHVPLNLPVTFTQTFTDDPTSTIVALGLGGDRRSALPALGPSYGEMDQPLQILVWNAHNVSWAELTHGPVNTTVAGRPARYYEHAKQGSVVVPPGSSLLLVVFGSCGVQVTVKDSKVITRTDLAAMVAGATFESCTDPKAWQPFG